MMHTSLGNAHASLETGKPWPKKAIKHCLDCPTVITKGKRCPPCSSIHFEVRKRERDLARSRR